jgi:hypothetical protein
MNKYRNSFFPFNFLWLIILLSSGNNPVLGQEKPINLTNTQVQGTITSIGKPLKNIVVSDGKEIVLTDEKGEFEFSTDQDFVFISYPSGYTFDLLENGSVDFFRKIDLNKATNAIHFDLKPNPNDEADHHFIAIADPQVQTEEEANQFITESCADLSKKKVTLNDPNLFGVGVGDLVFDKFELYAQYNEGIKSTGIPFFQVLGNHDIDLNARSNETAQAPFTKQFGPAYYSFNRGKTHYVVLNDVYFLGAKQYYGYLPETQLKWLEKDLALEQKDKPIVIFLHIPSFSQIVAHNPGRDINKESVINREALYEILEGYEAHLVSGHVHWNENTVTNHIFEHNTAAISGAWWSGICYDGTPKGYGVYRSSGGDLSWHYQSVGENKDFQFRLYPPGSHPDFPEDYMVNIWNWDPVWKVHAYEDGTQTIQPTQVIATDPLALETYGPGKPKKQPWISAQKNGHMFVFKPQDLHSKVEVEVIDRFGNKYKKGLD